MDAKEVWIDMNLPLASWLGERLGLPCRHFSQLGLATSTDHDAFAAARDSRAIVFTKDADFARLVTERGAPPQVVWVRVGNMTNKRLREILEPLMTNLIAALQADEPLIEIAGA